MGIVEKGEIIIPMSQPQKDVYIKGQKKKIKIANEILKYTMSLRTESTAENAVLFSCTNSSPETNVD